MQNILIPILVVLVGWLIHIRYKEVCQKRKNFDKEYSKFAAALFHFINAIQDEKISLNASLLEEFNEHKVAKELFTNNLSGRRLNRFNKKWTEYEKEYYQVKNLGVFGVTAAIAPSQEALAKATHLDAEK
ncbi:MAG TPA: hypothetical protein ENF36_10355, partial [Desulfobacteraceae bacterium]|nr:hypothetical protein [Desulfobacteraceae bacterium]